MKLSILALLLGSAAAFAPTVRDAARTTELRAITSPAPAEGAREIVEGPEGPIVVTKQNGEYYAVLAVCPHLNLPMKKGPISAEGPTLTCNFHNSQFDMGTGVCTKWITGALGIENGLVASIMAKAGGPKANIPAYEVTEAEGGRLELTLK